MTTGTTDIRTRREISKPRGRRELKAEAMNLVEIMMMLRCLLAIGLLATMAPTLSSAAEAPVRDCLEGATMDLPPAETDTPAPDSPGS